MTSLARSYSIMYSGQVLPRVNMKLKIYSRRQSVLVFVSLVSLFLMPTAMETELAKVPASKKEPSKRNATQKKPLATVSEISDDDDDDKDEVDDEDFELEVLDAPVTGKKGGRKPAAKAKAAKAPAAPKKRGAANKQQAQLSGQKLLTDMLKPAENSGISPEKKVRKMRESPFHKKSGSVLGRVNEANEPEEENSGSASTSASTEETVGVAPSRARPLRVNRKQTRYVLSDSESENPTDDSDFDEEEA